MKDFTTDSEGPRHIHSCSDCKLQHTPTPDQVSARLRDLAVNHGELRNELHEIADCVWSYRTAVNAHEALVESLRETLDALYNETSGEVDSEWINSVKTHASIAIAKAEGK